MAVATVHVLVVRLVMLPHTRTSVAVNIAFSSAVYILITIIITFVCAYHNFTSDFIIIKTNEYPVI